MRQHAQRDTHDGQGKDRHGRSDVVLHLVALAPHVVEQYVEDGHGNRGNPLAQAQLHGISVKAGRAERQRAGDQVERITGAQNDRHPAKQLELTVALAAANHANAEGNDRHQIDDVE